MSPRVSEIINQLHFVFFHEDGSLCKREGCITVDVRRGRLETSKNKKVKERQTFIDKNCPWRT